MADESVINTFTLSVALPIFPNLFFKINFNCNGVVFVSDEFASAADALSWAQSELSDFGEWSVDGNTLILDNCLCGVGSLSVTSSSIESQGGVTIEIDSSSPQTILDVWGLAAVDVSVDRQRSTDTDWKTKVSALTPTFIEPVTGTTSWWAKYKTPSDGYNISASEAAQRGLTLAQVLDGVGVPTYGYGFFEDAVAYMSSFSPKPEIVVSIDLNRPILLGSYATTYGEIDYVVSTCAGAGITIRSFQLCYELGIKDADDVFPTATSIQTATQTVVNYINTTYPTIDVSIDANNVDDTVLHKPTLNSLQNAVTGNEYLRQYFQFTDDLVTFEQLIDRVNEFPSFVTKFTQAFTHGQKMRLAQSTFKSGNPFRLKFAEGLIYSKLIMNVVNQNILHDNVVADFVQYNVSRVVSGTGELEPSYYPLLLLRGLLNNDGKVSVTYDNENLDIIGVKTGATAQLYIFNETEDFQSFDIVKLNGVEKTVTVDAYYNDPDADTANHYTASGRSILVYPHSLTVVSTV